MSEHDRSDSSGKRETPGGDDRIEGVLDARLRHVEEKLALDSASYIIEEWQWIRFPLPCWELR